MHKKIMKYGDYCTSIKNKEAEAYTVFSLRNWIISECEHFAGVSNGNNYIGLDELYPIENLKLKNDRLSYIVKESMGSFFRVFDNMREKTARKNVIMPAQKAKEINSSTVVWLSKQPGKNIREKIGNSNNRILAVNRYLSNDTPENRLLVACTKLLRSRIQGKIDVIGKELCSEEELIFFNRASSFLRSDIVSSISGWSNTPPNNALLSDKNYKKIWNAWTSLKNLDDDIQKDFESVSDNLFVFFTTELIANLKQYFYLPQMPVIVDYDKFFVTWGYRNIYGSNNSGDPLIIEIDTDKISIKSYDNQYSFDKDSLKKYFVSEKSITDCLNDAFDSIDIFFKSNKIIKNNSKYQFSERKYIDIISAIPSVVDANGEKYEEKQKVIYQEFLNSGQSGRDKYLFSCNNSDVLIVNDTTNTFTVKSAAENERTDVLQKIFNTLKKNINCNTLSMLINDGYDSFQLKSFKKSARSCFSDVDLFPESIAATFWYQNLSGLFESYNVGDLIIVANIIGNSFSLTPVCSVMKENSDVMVWERYPTTIEGTNSYDILKENLMKVGCPENKALEILNASGLKSLYSACSNILFNFDEQDTTSLNKYLHNLDEIISINISDKTDCIVKDMIEKYKNMNQSAHIIILSDLLVYFGEYDKVYAKSDDVIQGAVIHDRLFDELNSTSDSLHETLWRDHLPDLSIRRLFGEFPLIKNENRSPVLGKKQKIEIKDKFTLPAGKEEYRFELIQNDNGSDLRYQAVIRNEAFPLKYDTECYLNMYYQYDADDVYTLEFEPVDKLNAEFRNAKVEFVRSSGIEYNNLPSPVFPPEYTWDDLSKMIDKKWNGTAFSVIDWVINALNELEQQMLRRREVLNLKKSNLSLPQNKYQKSYYSFVANGKTLTIMFDYNNFNHPNDISSESEYISFILKKNTVYEIPVRTNENIYWGKDGTYFILNNYISDYSSSPISIMFRKSNFKDEDDYSRTMDTVVFNIRKEPNGRYTAINIELKEYSEQIDYIAENIQVDTKYDDKYFESPYRKTLFSASVSAFQTIYENGKSIYDEDCPNELRKICIRMKELLPQWYNGMRIPSEEELNNRIPAARRQLLNRMNIMARDMNDEYITLVVSDVKNSCQKGKKLPDYLGYVLGDLSLDYQKEILHYIINSRYWDRIDYFASNAWKNRMFIFNLDFEIVRKYSDFSIEKIIKIVSNREVPNYKYLHWYMEFLLACFRLRELHNSEINIYYSLQNSKMKELYNVLALLKPNKIWIQTFLNLQIKQENEMYDKLPYALACYLTGDMKDDDIIITVTNEER